MREKLTFIEKEQENERRLRIEAERERESFENSTKEFERVTSYYSRDEVA